VFLPGFSTAAKVSDVSGRGVGMDVVRTNIQKLNGSIEIRRSSARARPSSSRCR
jgi:two-component system chemotaxis sensor kinase CheA